MLFGSSSPGCLQPAVLGVLHNHLLMQAPITEAMQSDVVEDEGEIVVRMSTGNWYYLREDPADSKAFILEGGFGERFRLQTDKPV